jgi:hypothetical protein
MPSDMLCGQAGEPSAYETRDGSVSSFFTGDIMDNRKLAILLSGRGSNFVAIYEAIRRGDLHAEICCVISNVEGTAGFERACEFGLTAI